MRCRQCRGRAAQSASLLVLRLEPGGLGGGLLSPLAELCVVPKELRP
jgi:hypothetical protein